MYFSDDGGRSVLIKKKVCLVGDGEVGKTSLIRRFVTDSYDDAYITTVGTKVSKKESLVQSSGGMNARLDMAIWDIMGQQGFRSLLKQSYFYGSSGIIVVFDLTRRETFDAIENWMADVREVVGDKPPVIFFGNKCDLPERALEEQEMEDMAASYGGPLYYTSAKTGEFVDDAFMELAKRMLDSAEE